MECLHGAPIGREEMKRLAITGAIGSGKSTVCRALSALAGVPIYDSDLRARQIMNSHPQVRAELIELFGEEAYGADGLNRPYIAAKAFGDVELLQRLNGIVHPRVVEDFESWAESITGVPYVILESALLFTSPLVGHYDVSVAVEAPEQVRVERCMLRDGTTEENIRARMARQMTPQEMARRADRVVCNDGSRPLDEQLVALDRLMREKGDRA